MSSMDNLTPTMAGVADVVQRSVCMLLLSANCRISDCSSVQTNFRTWTGAGTVFVVRGCGARVSCTMEKQRITTPSQDMPMTIGS